jgi:Tol biopolymer transport system component
VTHSSRRLTNFHGAVRAPIWSPDGNRILFIEEHGNRTGTITIAAPSTNNGKPAVHLPKSTPPDFGVALYTASIANGKLTKLDGGQLEDIEDAVYSPDGKQIAYLKDVWADHGKSGSYAQLYVMNSDGSNKRRLTNHRGFDYTPHWTRDSRNIVIGSDCGQAGVNLNGNWISQDGCLRIVDAASGTQHAVHLPAPVRHIDLSP